MAIAGVQPLTVAASQIVSEGNSSRQNKKEVQAAKDFEALLIGQMLRSMHEDGSGWLGTGDDQADDAAFGLGEQQLAQAMSANGGLGLAKLIASGLSARENSTQTQGETPVNPKP
jgi:Rod binding domain-containing protein